jgi:hypothetical protein
MKTTELYIEQVLIGFAIVAIAVLLWLPRFWVLIQTSETHGAIAGASILLGIAFWLGIPFDRFADTLVERLDRHSRLRFALKSAEGKQAPTTTELTAVPDLFPEAQLRIACLRDKKPIVDWHYYLRSRIRLSRALAVYGPALTLAATVGVQCLPAANPVCLLAANPVCWLILIVVAYLAWLLLVQFGEKVGEGLGHRLGQWLDHHGGKNSDNAKATLNKRLEKTFGRELPRTDKKNFWKYAKDYGWIGPENRIVDPKVGDWLVWISEPPTWIVPAALLILALVWSFFRAEPSMIATAGGGTMVTIVSAWSWWRTTGTYLSFLHDRNRFVEPDHKAPTPNAADAPE